MFTGIISTTARVAAAATAGGDLRLTIDIAGTALEAPAPGDSIAVNGVCLTATTLDAGRLIADVSAQTLALTTLGALATGDCVNLEPALAAGEPLGGHLVSGHVDGVGELMERTADGRSRRLVFAVPAALTRFIAVKGSICIDGISLTVNEVSGDRLGVNIVPYTLTHTNLNDLAVGGRVNLEVDMVARYLDRLLQSRS